MTYGKYGDHVFSNGPTCLLFSGGLDSVCIDALIRYDGLEHMNFYVPHDIVYGYRERQAIVDFEERLGARSNIRISHTRANFLPYEQSDGFIPLRNLLLVSYAVQAGFNTVFLGAVRGEESLDKSQQFCDETSRLLSFLLGRTITVAIPFAGYTKAQLVTAALHTRLVTEADLRATWSCYMPIENKEGTAYIPCGRCQACMRRWIAMEENGIEEAYAMHPADSLVGQSFKANLLLRLLLQPVDRWFDIVYNNITALITLWKYKLRKIFKR